MFGLYRFPLGGARFLRVFVVPPAASICGGVREGSPLRWDRVETRASGVWRLLQGGYRETGKRQYVSNGGR